MYSVNHTYKRQHNSHSALREESDVYAVHKHEQQHKRYSRFHRNFKTIYGDYRTYYSKAYEL